MSRKIRPITLILSLILLALACDVPAVPPGGDPSPLASTQSASWYSVYFTEPGASDFYTDGPDQALANAIDQARLSIDAAIYDLDLDSVGNALRRAHERGVTVRLVAESDYMDEDAMQALIEAGLPVITDRREGLMHNKFIVIDRLEVWTGSMNFTSNGAYRNNNNLIRLRSTQIAENYLTEFNEMFADDLFGPDTRKQTPHPTLTISGSPVETYFSPDDGVLNHLLDLVDSAQESVCFLVFSFTADELGDALIAAHKDGLQVSGVFEESQYKSNGEHGEYDTLRAAGIDVWLDANPRNMHHKVFVIDRQIVWTGSYNFSNNAEKRNDENVVVIHNPDMAALYQAECEKLLDEARR